jgi:predicted phosphodiesterase
MVRLGLLSDVHGNPLALDAVLADIERLGGADSYWILGDIVAIGYDPIGALMRLTSLPNARFVQGNTDRYVVTGQRPHPHLSDVEADPRLLQQLVEVARTFAWTQGYVTAAGWFDWLAALPMEQRLDLPDGTRLLGVHVAPGLDDGVGLHPSLSDAELGGMVRGAEADLICAGHTHRPMDRTLDGVRIINIGSVSNPHPSEPDRRASYVLLDASVDGYVVQHHRVEYDYEQVVEAVKQSRHPSGAYIIRHFVR